MVPTYRDFTFLEATLTSVTRADAELGEQPQITVVDDGSPEPPHAIVDKFASFGVELEINAVQQGAIGNFNRCLHLARGEFVHLLHSDDVVYPGFYRRAERAFSVASSIGGYVCRCDTIDADGAVVGASRQVSARAGVWSDAQGALAWRNSLRFPGVALRRSVSDKLGGFNPDLPHTADWEYWARVAAESDWWWDPKIGAGYRIHDASDTSRLMRDGSNNAERRRCVAAIASRPGNAATQWTTRGAHLYSTLLAIRDAQSMLVARDTVATRAQLREAISSLRAAFAVA